MAKVLLKGNEALAEAALAAGCRFTVDIRSPRRQRSWSIYPGEWKM